MSAASGGERTGPLSDLVILDCTMALAGPFGTALLADLGADVVKIEPPKGDMSRPGPPFPENYVTPASGEEGCDFGGYFASINRNKRSLCLDFKVAADRELFLSMCGKADAVTENMRAGVMDRLGVGYEAIRERNPKIVYAAIRGFGDPRTGESPHVDWPAFDIVAQAMGGFAHINGPAGAAGYPGGASVGDLFPGTLMALGLVSAVHHARRTGEGQFLDVAMVDAVNLLCESAIVNYGSPQKTLLGPRGEHHPSLCPFGIYPTRDGGVAIAAPLPAQWKVLCGAMARPDLLHDERTRDAAARRQNRTFVEESVRSWTQSVTRAAVLQALGGEVPCGPVQSAADIFASAHTEARQMLVDVEMPGGEDFTIVDQPIKFTATPAGVRHRAPKLDEHRAEILSQFGVADRARSTSNEE